MYSTHTYDWYQVESKDIDFSSRELGRQNGLSVDGSGKMFFPDYATKTYRHPRIFEIKSDIYEIDTGKKNTINMFAQATDDDSRARQDNFVEFGKYIIT